MLDYDRYWEVADTKRIAFELDRASWTDLGRAVPRALIAIEGLGYVEFSLREALLRTAFLTRPPAYSGFRLGDTWAWQRYIPAFRPGRPLRLKTDWAAVDPHQKTVMSDEVAVGVIASVLGSHMGWNKLVDAIHFAKVVCPDRYQFLRTRKTGPAKSPDYVHLDAAQRLHVVECKGSQAKGADLRRAVHTGVAQKQNVVPVIGDALMGERLVAGLYLAQATSAEESFMRVRDPEGPTGTLLGSPTQLAQAIGVVSMAKALSFAGGVVNEDDLSLDPAGVDAIRRVGLRLLKRPHEAISSQWTQVADTMLGTETAAVDVDLERLSKLLDGTPLDWFEAYGLESERDSLGDREAAALNLGLGVQLRLDGPIDSTEL